MNQWIILNYSRFSLKKYTLPEHNLTLLKVIWSVVLNQIAIGIPSSYVMYYLMRWRGFPGIRELPTFHWVLYELAIHILVEEAAFYYSHRSLIITLETSEILIKTFQVLAQQTHLQVHP